MFSFTLLLLAVHTVVPDSSEIQCECYNGRHEIHLTGNQDKHNGICNVSWNSLLSDTFAECESTQVILHQGSYTVSGNTNYKNLKKTTKYLDVTGESTAIISCTEDDSIFKLSQAFTTAYKIRIRNLHFQNCTEILIESDLKNASIEIINSSLTKSCLKVHRKRWSDKTDIVIQNSIVNHCKCTDAIVVFSSTSKISPSMTLHDVTISENESPFFVSKFNVNVTRGTIKVRGFVTFSQN